MTTELCCDHCGDAAVESRTGIFYEGMAEKCASCGHPGQVHADEADVYWSINQDDWHARCERGDCRECDEASRDALAREFSRDGRAKRGVGGGP